MIFEKNDVTLKTGVMMLKMQLCITAKKSSFVSIFISPKFNT